MARHPRRYVIRDAAGQRVGEIKATSARAALEGFKPHVPAARHRGLQAEKDSETPTRQRVAGPLFERN